MKRFTQNTLKFSFFVGLFFGLFSGNVCPGVEPARAGASAWEVEVTFEAQGHLLLLQEKGKARVPLRVRSRQQYEQYYVVYRQVPTSLCWYQQAEADVEIDGQKVPQRLPEQRRLLAVQTLQDRVLLFRPRGALSRDELDLLDVPGHPHALQHMLQQHSGPWEPDAAWRPHNARLAALLGLDAVGASTVRARVRTTDRELGHVTVVLSGQVDGAIYGVATQIDLKATLRATWPELEPQELKMTIREKRSIGHVGPGLDVEATVRLKRRRLSRPVKLVAQLDQFPRQAADASTLRLELVQPELGLHLEHDRRWHVVHVGEQGLAMRLLDRGELVAQCNIGRAPREEGPLSAEAWRERIRRSLGEHFVRWSQPPRTLKLQNGNQALHLRAEGEVEQLPIVWDYWVVRSPGGHQATVLFTLEKKFTGRFGNADRLIVHTLRFLALEGSGKPATAGAGGRGEKRR